MIRQNRKGKVPFHETDYYFKDHPEYMHFMRVDDSLIKEYAAEPVPAPET